MRTKKILIITLTLGLITLWGACGGSKSSKVQEQTGQESDAYVIGPGERISYQFTIDDAGIAILDLSLATTNVTWRMEGNESVILRSYVDGKSVSDIVVPGLEQGFKASLLLGEVGTGSHTVELYYDIKNSPAKYGQVVIQKADWNLHVIKEDDPHFDVAKYAPVIYGKSFNPERSEPINTYSDTPLAMICSQQKGNDGSQVLTYYLATSNVDGGLGSAPRVMLAKTGMLGDLFAVSEVVIDPSDQILNLTVNLNDRLQEFNGDLWNTHPVVKISGWDNSLSENFNLSTGDEPRFFLNPTTYPIFSDPAPAMLEKMIPNYYLITYDELMREQKVADTSVGDPIVGSSAGTAIADFRNYIFIDYQATSPWAQASLAFEVSVASSKVYQSDYYDYGDNELYLLRSTFPSRTAVELPAGTEYDEVEVLSMVYRGSAELEQDGWLVTDIKAYYLDEEFRSHSFFSWEGNQYLYRDTPRLLLTVEGGDE